MKQRIFKALTTGLLVCIGVLTAAGDSCAAAWTFTYKRLGSTYTYPTRYATEQEAIRAFRAWKDDRYPGNRNPPVFIRTNYLRNEQPDARRHPY